MAPVGYEQATFDSDADCFEPLQFLKEGDRIENNAAADNAGDVMMKDPGRDDVQNMTPAPEVDRVSRIVPALVTRDTVKPLSKDIDDLSLALIAPLGADDDDEFTHAVQDL